MPFDGLLGRNILRLIHLAWNGAFGDRANELRLGFECQWVKHVRKLVLCGSGR